MIGKTNLLHRKKKQIDANINYIMETLFINVLT